MPPQNGLQKVYGKPSPKKLLPEEQALRDELNVAPTGDNVRPGIMQNFGSLPMVGQLPLVPRAPNFRPETQVNGSPEFARQVEALHKLAPELRGRTPKIQMGYDDNYINDIVKSENPRMLDNVYGLNLRGITNFKNKNIAVNPYFPAGGKEVVNYGAQDAAGTIAHEYKHIVGQGGLESGRNFDGYQSELDSERVGKMAEKIGALRKIYK